MKEQLTGITTADIVEWMRAANLSIADRVSILRTLRDTTPNLVAVDPRILGRVHAAQAVSPNYVDTTVNALEGSQVWQQSASTTPEELRGHHSFAAEHRPLMDEIQAYGEILKYNLQYQHFLGVGKARAAFRVAKEMTGDATVSIHPHLPIIAAARPTVGRRRRRPETVKAPPEPIVKS